MAIHRLCMPSQGYVRGHRTSLKGTVVSRLCRRLGPSSVYYSTYLCKTHRASNNGRVDGPCSGSGAGLLVALDSTPHTRRWSAERRVAVLGRGWWEANRPVLHRLAHGHRTSIVSTTSILYYTIGIAILQLLTLDGHDGRQGGEWLDAMRAPCSCIMGTTSTYCTLV